MPPSIVDELIRNEAVLEIGPHDASFTRQATVSWPCFSCPNAELQPVPMKISGDRTVALYFEDYLLREYNGGGGFSRPAWTRRAISPSTWGLGSGPFKGCCVLPSYRE